jgi:D-xylonolactonase
MADAQPELVASSSCEIGENPLWHPLEERLYWVDIPRGQLFRMSGDGSDFEIFPEGPPIGGFTAQADGSLLLFMAHGVVAIWREGALETVLAEILDERDSRFNDVIADPEGRVFCGTMPTDSRPGRLYRMDVDGSIRVVIEDAGLSNGLGFTPDGAYLYHTNTRTREISRYAYDRKTGELGERELFVSVGSDAGGPDGMTVDRDGFVWSARWGGSALVRYTPDGVEERRVSFPCAKVSSAAFGGATYTDLYVTTAGGGDASEGDGAGHVYRIVASCPGAPEPFSRVRL